MILNEGDFPFEEIARFDRASEALAAGYDLNQIWSVVEGEDGWWVYGPPRHYVNRLYVVVTAERHDDNTYYQEKWS